MRSFKNANFRTHAGCNESYYFLLDYMPQTVAFLLIFLLSVCIHYLHYRCGKSFGEFLWIKTCIFPVYCIENNMLLAITGMIFQQLINNMDAS